MTDQNRITPTTVANQETDRRTAPIAVTHPKRDGDPGQGGWTPSGGQLFAATMAVSVLGALAPVLITTIPGIVGLIASVVIGGVATGLAAFFGIKSAGPRKLE